MRLFGLDQHISVIEDIKHVLAGIGHEVDVHNLSHHNFVFNREHPGNFGGFKPDFYWQYVENDGLKFYEEFKEQLGGYDGFITTYPPAFARLFTRFEKPIIMQLPIRYEHYFSFNPDKWREFNAWAVRLHKSGQLKVVSNSLYDQAYFQHFTGIQPIRIENLCEYTGVSYQGTKETALLWDSRSERVDSLIRGEVPNVNRLRALYPRYEWSEIVKHRAFIHVPYNASVMSFFEHYAMNVPLFVPTPDYLLQLKELYGALSELTWNQSCNNQPQGSAIEPFYQNQPDPNAYQDPMAVRHWMIFYDHYNLEHVQQFDSLNDLRRQLESADLRMISGMMRENNVARRAKIRHQWASLMSGIEA